MMAAWTTLRVLPGRRCEEWLLPDPEGNRWKLFDRYGAKSTPRPDTFGGAWRRCEGWG